MKLKNNPLILYLARTVWWRERYSPPPRLARIRVAWYTCNNNPDYVIIYVIIFLA